VLSVIALVFIFGNFFELQQQLIMEHVGGSAGTAWLSAFFLCLAEASAVAFVGLQGLLASTVEKVPATLIYVKMVGLPVLSVLTMGSLHRSSWRR
jgi:hypothetical protein